jgi:hypothetical protein
VFGLADWHRDGTLSEYVAIEARNLAQVTCRVWILPLAYRPAMLIARRPRPN